jgi:hypothetical protein
MLHLKILNFTFLYYNSIIRHDILKCSSRGRPVTGPKHVAQIEL